VSAFNQVLWTLDKGIEPKKFESLCLDLLGREGYQQIVPVGGSKDHGRDAEIRAWTGVSYSGDVTFFQFSLEDRWQQKLREDAAKARQYGHSISCFVFVTSQEVTGAAQDKLRAEFRSQYGWELTIYSRAWFRHRLEEFHQDLAKKYLGVDLPETPPHTEILLSSCGSGGGLSKELFRETSAELVKGRLHQSAKRDPKNPTTWTNLAKVEYHLRDYDAALRSINRALELKPKDTDFLLLKAGILGDGGIARHHRAWVTQSRDIFASAAERLGHYVDHYNLANVLAPLGETAPAERHYRICLQKKPDFAPAWRNLATVLFSQQRHAEEMECYEKALHLDPSLVEAHVGKAITLLRVFRKPEEAIRCFEQAYTLDPDLDQKWTYVRFWLSKAWAALGNLPKAIEVIEVSVRDNPGDIYLSNQKAIILGRLWRADKAFQTAAIDFFQERARSVRNDYRGLVELIDLFTARGIPDEAWQFLASSLDLAPYALLDLGKRAGITLQDFRAGFRNALMYQSFRSFQRLEDHLVTLHQNGLSPNPNILKALNQCLMAPFGQACERLGAAPPDKRLELIPMTFDLLLGLIGRIMSGFGANWLCKAKPPSHDEQVDLLARGMLLLPEAVIAEASRHIGFILGILGATGDIADLVGKRNYKECYADVAVQLLASAAEDWQWKSPKP
jgi:tetratricopeptide (TPR) repeat protein